LRAGLGDVALRIDHIGSTSVPGLAARFREDRRACLDAKGPFLWEVMRQADG
jgi:GrpB-like predicted nucleotidyltransferase (UPF0157 family)